MDAFKQLREDWAALHATFAQKIKDSHTGHIISSDLQYATTAWHNKLKVWCEELDQLIEQYPPELGLEHQDGLREASLPKDRVRTRINHDAARP